VLSYVLWPFVITAGTGATYLGLESGYPLPAVFFAVGAGMLACVLFGPMGLAGMAAGVLLSTAPVAIYRRALP